MRIAFVVTILLVALSTGARAETDVAKPQRKIGLQDINNARFVQPGCAVLASHNPEDAKKAESDRMLTISIWQCAGAMKAVTELMMMEHEYCPPDDALTYWKNYQIVDKFMQAPGNLDHPIGIVFYNAFHQAWPCPNEQAMKKGAVKDSPHN